MSSTARPRWSALRGEAYLGCAEGRGAQKPPRAASSMLVSVLGFPARPRATNERILSQRPCCFLPPRRLWRAERRCHCHGQHVVTARLRGNLSLEASAKAGDSAKVGRPWGGWRQASSASSISCDDDANAQLSFSSATLRWQSRGWIAQSDWTAERSLACRRKVIFANRDCGACA